MKLETIQNNEKPLAEQIADQIANLIAENTFQKGERLPNEFQLARAVGVGRGTIREAIKILVSRNIVEIRRGLGTFVSEKTGLTDDPLGLNFVEDKSRLALDLMEVRTMIEPDIAALAAMRASKEDVKKIRQSCLAVEEKIRQNQDFVTEDIAFHETIARSSKNQVVPNVIPVIHSAIREQIKATNANLTEKTIATHRAITTAIAEKNPHAAKEAMLEHMRYNQEHIEKLIKARSNTP